VAEIEAMEEPGRIGNDIEIESVALVSIYAPSLSKSII